MLKKFFQKFENFIFDLDGTVWRWTELIKGFEKVYQILRNLGKNIYFVTDSTLLTRDGYAKKLQNFGLDVKADHIINPSLPAVEILRGKKVFCIGEGLITDLRKAGIKVTSSNPDAVLVGMDRTVNYEKLSMAVGFIMKGAVFFKTAKSNIFINGNKILPGTGAIAKVIELTTGKKPQLIGAPSKYMVNVFESLGLKPEKTVLFGDECDSDIALGNVLGYTTVLVTTGRDGEIDYLKARGINEPNLVLKSVEDVLS